MRIAHGVASPVDDLLPARDRARRLAFELTQPGFGFAGFAGVGIVALAVYGIWVVPPFWPGLAAAARRCGTHDARRPDSATCRALHGVGAGRVRAPDRCSRGTAWPPRSGSRPWLIGGAIGRELPLLRVRSHRGDAVARPDREHPARADRPGRARRAASWRPRARCFVKGAIWRGRSDRRRRSHPGTPDAGPGGRRPGPAGRGRPGRHPRPAGPGAGARRLAFPPRPSVAVPWRAHASGTSRGIPSAAVFRTTRVRCSTTGRPHGSTSPPAAARTPRTSSRPTTSRSARRRTPGRRSRRRICARMPGARDLPRVRAGGSVRRTGSGAA